MITQISEELAEGVDRMFRDGWSLVGGVAVAVVAVVGLFFFGYIAGEGDAFRSIDDGRTLLTSCVQTTTTQVIDGKPIETEAFYCQVLD